MHDPKTQLGGAQLMSLDPFAIRGAALQDRLEDVTEADLDLRRSIKTFGQITPVLVRPHPDARDQYQIVFGRRRVLALRDLGRPVLAMVQDLDDIDALVAQGQENTARRNLSYIEKAHFALQMRDAGFARSVICDALGVNKTLVSRMLSIFDAIPVAVVAAIGAAPSIGRDRWQALADLFEARRPDTDMVLGYVGLCGRTSDQRFLGLLHMLARGPQKEIAARAKPVPMGGAEGINLGHVSRRKGRLVMSFRCRASDGFEDWLLENLTQLHRDWLAVRGAERP